MTTDQKASFICIRVTIKFQHPNYYHTRPAGRARTQQHVDEYSARSPCMATGTATPTQPWPPVCASTSTQKTPTRPAQGCCLPLRSVVSHHGPWRARAFSQGRATARTYVLCTTAPALTYVRTLVAACPRQHEGAHRPARPPVGPRRACLGSRRWCVVSGGPASQLRLPAGGVVEPAAPAPRTGRRAPACARAAAREASYHDTGR